MTDSDLLLSEFIDAWNGGQRPNVREYLKRAADDADRDRLADAIDAWLQVAPTPDYGADARAAIRAEPAVQHVFAAVDAEAGLWPQALPVLRTRARLSVAQLAARLVPQLSLRPADEARTAAYLEQLERGELEPTRVSRRLLQALGEVLGPSPSTLADAGAFGRTLRPAAAGGALLRAEGNAAGHVEADLAVLACAAAEPVPPTLDAVDRLFVGGRDA